MSDKPRRWFRIHLSTAIVMMFVAGGLIWANVVTRGPVSPIESNFSTRREYESALMKWWQREFAYGWPLTAYETGVAYPAGTGSYRNWIWQGITINIATCIVTLASVAFICECSLRRREARKRRWFQIHPSTAVVVMFLAGFLLWLSAPITSSGHYDLYFNLHDPATEKSLEGLKKYVEQSSWGWPTKFYFTGEVRVTDTAFDGVFDRRFDVYMFVVDFVVAIALMLIAMLTIEGIIRRREARKL